VAGHGRKDGQAVVEWGTTVEHTVWGACARHEHQLNDDDKLKDNLNGLGFILFVGFQFQSY
jgi:hypothetical protein